MHASWLRQGFFVLGDDGFMPSVRRLLEQHLSQPQGTLRIRNYPVASHWKHTYWWREGKTEFAEAQFFAQIAKSYPVLSLGVAIEKGFEDERATADTAKLMDRHTWDWPRLPDNIDEVLATDVVEAAQGISGPVNLRINSKRVVDGESLGWEMRAFSIVEGTWYERYVGAVTPDTIASYIRGVDERRDSWVIVHFGEDLAPTEAEGLSPEQTAVKLMRFNPVRRRLRGVPSAILRV